MRTFWSGTWATLELQYLQIVPLRLCSATFHHGVSERFARLGSRRHQRSKLVEAMELLCNLQLSTPHFVAKSFCVGAHGPRNSSLREHFQSVAICANIFNLWPIGMHPGNGQLCLELFALQCQLNNDIFVFSLCISHCIWIVVQCHGCKEWMPRWLQVTDQARWEICLQFLALLGARS